MMTRLGMLPGFDDDYRTPRATLAPNDRLGYWDSWVRLAADPARRASGPAASRRWSCPRRHGEGKFLTESPEVLERLEIGHQIVRCATSTGAADR